MAKSNNTLAATTTAMAAISVTKSNEKTEMKELQSYRQMDKNKGRNKNGVLDEIESRITRISFGSNRAAPQSFPTTAENIVSVGLL